MDEQKKGTKKEARERREKACAIFYEVHGIAFQKASDSMKKYLTDVAKEFEQLMAGKSGNDDGQQERLA